jgi:glycosyltransferase involved in cell wall biosynthesis
VALNLAASLRERGHPVLFLHPGEGPPRAGTTAAGWPGYRMELRAFDGTDRPLRTAAAFCATLPGTLARLDGLVRRHGIRVVNVHYPVETFAALGVLRALRREVRLIVSVHGSDLMPRGRRRAHYPASLRLLLDRADCVIAPSLAYRNAVAGVFPGLAGRTVAIHNGVDRAVLAAGGPSPVPAPYLLCVAAFHPWKGVDVLLRAFAMLTGDRPALRLVLAGYGPQEGALRAMAAELGIAARVLFTGERTRAQVAALLRGCEALALPSRAETFGLAAAEAMACGKAVVASAVGGVPEVVRDGREGLLVPPDDPPALAAALGRVLDDRALATRLGRAGEAAVRTRFSREHTGAAYAARIDSLLA